MRLRSLRWMLGIGLACAALMGCEKSAEQQMREAEKASAEADKKTAQAANEANQQSREARDKAERELGDVHAAVIREKSDYRSKLHDALDEVDKDLADKQVDVKQLKRGDRSNDQLLYGKDRSVKDYDALEGLILRRDRLMNLNDQIDSTIDHDWPSYKARLDRELESKDKPVQKPGRT